MYGGKRRKTETPTDLLETGGASVTVNTLSKEVEDLSLPPCQRRLHEGLLAVRGEILAAFNQRCIPAPTRTANAVYRTARRRYGSVVQCVVVWLIAIAVVVGMANSSQAEEPLSPADARTMEEALGRILLNAATEHRTGAVRTVAIDERSFNAWFRFQATDTFPAGVTDPQLDFEGSGRMIARATVDLDGLREQQAERSLFDPLRYLSGRLPVSAVGLIQASEGTIRVDIESVEVGSVAVPATLVHELVRYYTRSDSQPDGIDLTESFPLPYSIEALRIEPRRLVVVQ